jgi:integrase
MKGHIRSRGKQSWQIIFDIARDPGTGKRRQHRETVKGTKREAETRLRELLHSLETGVYVKPSKITLAEFLERWLSDYARPNLSPRGFERYAGIVRQHLIPDMGGLALIQLRPEHIQQHYTAKLNNGLSARTVQYHHAVLHKALQTAVKWGLVGRNVADGVDVPRAQHNDMQTWDEDDIQRFLSTAAGKLYYELFYLAIFTGMRRGELLALRWSDIDFVFSQISVNRALHQLKDNSYIFTQPKSEKSRRTIALPPSASLMLKKYRENQSLERALIGKPLIDNDLVFSQYDGKPIRPNTVTRAWTLLAARAGVKVIRLHDARHTHASLLLKQGVHPKIVQERLGHSSISMTLDTYSHVAPGLQQAAAERFDDLLGIKPAAPVSNVAKMLPKTPEINHREV